MRYSPLPRIVLIAMLGLSGPAQAEGPTEYLRRGLELFGEGARQMLEGLMDEIEPLLEEEVVPMLERLGALVDDLSHYQLPELLPNGDILIRRAPDAPPLGRTPPEIGEDGAVEL